MKRDWAKYLSNVLAWTGVGSVAALSSAVASPSPAQTAVDTTSEGAGGLTLDRPLNENGLQRFAGHSSHSSHASHASHSSHYSSSSGGYTAPTYTPSYPTYTPPPSPPPTPPPPSPSPSGTAAPAPLYTPPSTPSATAPAQQGSSKPTKAEKSVMVMRVQLKLRQLGYYGNVINGRLDADTVDAIENFQLVNELESTGKLDDATLAKLGVAY